MNKEKEYVIRALFVTLCHTRNGSDSFRSARMMIHGFDFLLVNEPSDTVSIYHQKFTISDDFIFRVSVVHNALCIAERPRRAPGEGPKWDAALGYFRTVINNAITQSLR